MLRVCVCQGMDAVTRQTGQHIEFEPEWEGAFNLQLKLADNVAILQEWCGTDVSGTGRATGNWGNCGNWELGGNWGRIVVPRAHLMFDKSSHLPLLMLANGDTFQFSHRLQGRYSRMFANCRNSHVRR